MAAAPPRPSAWCPVHVTRRYSLITPPSTVRCRTGASSVWGAENLSHHFDLQGCGTTARQITRGMLAPCSLVSRGVPLRSDCRYGDVRVVEGSGVREHVVGVTGENLRGPVQGRGYDDESSYGVWALLRRQGRLAEHRTRAFVGV